MAEVMLILEHETHSCGVYKKKKKKGGGPDLVHGL